MFLMLPVSRGLVFFNNLWPMLTNKAIIEEKREMGLPLKVSCKFVSIQVLFEYLMIFGLRRFHSSIRCLHLLFTFLNRLVNNLLGSPLPLIYTKHAAIITLFTNRLLMLLPCLKKKKKYGELFDGLPSRLRIKCKFFGQAFKTILQPHLLLYFFLF